MKICCNVFNVCNKYRKFKNPKISYAFKKTLDLSIVYSKCGHEYRKLFKEEDSIEILKIFGLVTNIEEYQKIYNHVWRKHSQEFRLKNINETRNYFIKEINQNELMSRKLKKVCTTLNYSEQFLIWTSTITGCISISAFASLIGVRIGITSSAIGLKICAIAAGIKEYKSIMKKKKKKHDNIVLLAKTKLNSIEVLTFKALIDSVISHDEFVLINNVRKEYDDMKEEIKNLKA